MAHATRATAVAVTAASVASVALVATRECGAGGASDAGYLKSMVDNGLAALWALGARADRFAVRFGVVARAAVWISR
jgi:hypothetical protein